MLRPLSCLLIMTSTVLLYATSFSQKPAVEKRTISVGVARIDITPVMPIRLAGYGNRKNAEAGSVMHRLWAKALAFGTDAQQPSIFISVDLIGIPRRITEKLVEELAQETGIDASRLVICASHTHGGPELGNLQTVLQYRDGGFSDSLLRTDHLVHIAQYVESLQVKLKEVALVALENRKPALVDWGQGQAGFARNRRPQGGPVDPSLPILRVSELDGKPRAILANYACHGTTLHGSTNEVHGDWMSEAQQLIEQNHPGVTALISIGCGADADPQPRGEIQHMKSHGKEIADNVNKLLTAQLQPLTSPPVARLKWVKLPFAKIPTVKELITQSEDKTVKGYYARLTLQRVLRGDTIAAELEYPVQTWTFGNELAMINIGGEVVVDYSVRLKNKLGADKIWMNAYANDVACYIASKRVIREGGYEAESSMYYYDKPSAFKEEVEEIIINTVHELLPAAFKEPLDSSNNLQTIKASSNGELHLTAAKANAIGPNIKYMPEWKAFGWFNTDDRSEWQVKVQNTALYDVYLDWSVSDAEAGKAYVFEAGNQKIRGRIGKTGSWFTFRKEKIGRISLTAGTHQMIFKSGSKTEKGAMLDLRKLVLVQVK